MQVKIKILNDKVRQWGLPKYATSHAAGLDLRACIDTPLVVKAGQVQMVGTGIAIYLADEHLAGLILPRSGLGAKHGIVLGNLVGLIDADYQGELKLCVWNRSDSDYTVEVGERLAQYVVVPIVRAQFEVVDEFLPSIRGDGGFGHTGR